MHIIRHSADPAEIVEKVCYSRLKERRRRRRKVGARFAEVLRRPQGRCITAPLSCNIVPE